MRYCKQCKAFVRDNTSFCPLCDSGLEIDKSETALPRAYPPTNLRKTSYSLLKRIILFCSIMTGAICVVINAIHPEPLWWSLIVVTAIVYSWVVIPHSLRRGGNYAGKIFTQVVCGIALVVLIDFEIGWSAWSVNYAVPVMLCTGITAVGLVALCNSTNWARYVMYQIVLALFGFVPLVLYFAGVTRNWLFAIITSGFALATIIAMLVFGDRSIKNEFKRRLRF